MKWMTKTQRETFIAIAELSPGNSRPWLTAEDIFNKRVGSKELTSHQRGAVLDWIKSYLGKWSAPGAFMETRIGKHKRVWRMSRKGKRLAIKGDLD